MGRILQGSRWSRPGSKSKDRVRFVARDAEQFLKGFGLLELWWRASWGGWVM